MRYKVLFCDADDTLFDFQAAEKAALQKTLVQYGIPADEVVCKLYNRLNDALWKALERGETTQQALKTERFRQLLKSIDHSGDAHALADLYAFQLGQCAHLLPGAQAFIEAVSAEMPVYLVTNGISVIQRSRLALSSIRPFISDMIVSEEVGVRKPDPQMILIALEKSGYDKKEAVMLGDSLTADIAGAVNAGIDSIWLHWGKAHRQSNATYEVADLKQAQSIILN